MSELSLKLFCMEFNSRHVKTPDPDVYALFEKNGKRREALTVA